MEKLLDILLDVEFIKWAVPLLSGVMAWLLNEWLKRQQEKWEIKRTACLEALTLIDAHFANEPEFKQQTDPKTGNQINIQAQEKPNIAKVREVYNKLCLSCDKDDVLRWYKRCLGLYGPYDAGMIVDLRNAIRKELRFGGNFDTDRDKAWVGQLGSADNAGK